MTWTLTEVILVVIGICGILIGGPGGTAVTLICGVALIKLSKKKG